MAQSELAWLQELNESVPRIKIQYKSGHMVDVHVWSTAMYMYNVAVI